MILLRLLTAGKSLVGVRETEHRYRLTSQRLLPEFGSARNPFRPAERASPAEGPAQAPANRAGRGNDASAQQQGSPTPVERQMPAFQREEGAQATPAPTSGPGFVRRLMGSAVVPVSGWLGKLKGLLLRPRARKPKPAIPRFTEAPVQGELSLDRIKVVRNDLSDADLEVVPAKQPAAGASAARRAQPEQTVEVARSRKPQAAARIATPSKA